MEDVSGDSVLVPDVPILFNNAEGNGPPLPLPPALALDELGFGPAHSSSSSRRT